MDLQLKGKVALVAGASKGLGFAVAQALAREGAIVSISSRDEASITAAGAAVSFDDAAWQDAADLLLFSALRMVRAAVPSMQSRGGGAILFSTSSSVKEPVTNLGLSTVLRASVSALAKTLALELAPRIRVNQIIPGRIDTDRVRHLDEGNAKRLGIPVEEAKAKAIATIPFGRYGEIDEFGRVGAFLLSNAASYVTGATVQVDGGLIRSVL